MTVPQQELSTYSAAFSKARDASQRIYAELIPIYEATDRAMARTSTPNPAEVSSFVAAAPGDQTVEPLSRAFIGSLGPGFRRQALPCRVFEPHPTLNLRCQAFAIVARYNELMVAATEDANRPAISQEIASVQAAISPFVALSQTVSGPIAGMSFTAITAMLDEARTAQANDRIATILRDGLPQIRELIALLKRDVELVYEVKRAATETEYALIRARFSQADDTFMGIYELFEAPSTSDEQVYPLFAKLTADYREALEPLAHVDELGVTKRLAYLEEPRDDPDPFTADEVGELSLFLANVEAQSAAFLAAEKNFKTFDKALQEYDRMLSKLDLAAGELYVATAPEPLVNPASLLMFISGPLQWVGLAPGTDEAANDAGLSTLLTEIFLHADLIQDLLLPVENW
ncbi:MAG: hypothetical protein AAFV62_06630 [Pseudomonadota bacterium]